MARKRTVSGNAGALELALEAMNLDDGHAALAQLARTLAATLDANPGDANVAREYRQVLSALGEVGAGDDGDTAAFLISVQTPGMRTAVRNPSQS